MLKLDSLSMMRIVAAFDGGRPIQAVAIEENLDQRVVRRIWRQTFGDAAVKKRGCNQRTAAAVATNTIDDDKISQARLMVSQGIGVMEISSNMGVSPSWIRNVVSQEPDLYRAMLAKTSDIRRTVLQKLRAPNALTENKQQAAVALANSDMTLAEIGHEVGVSKSSAANLLKCGLSKEQYGVRTKRMRRLARRHAMESLVRAGKLGSRPENEFYKLLRLALATKVIHHDFDILPPFEIDITLPQLKVAILWDGVGHRKPVFGESILRKVQNRDRWKRKRLAEIDWMVFEVKDDNSRLRTTFLEAQVGRLFALLDDMNHAETIRRF